MTQSRQPLAATPEVCHVAIKAQTGPPRKKITARVGEKARQYMLCYDRKPVENRRFAFVWFLLLIMILRFAVIGLERIAAHKSVPIRVTGVIQSPFPLSRSRRFVEP